MTQVMISFLILVALAGCSGDEPVGPNVYLVEYQLSMERIEVPPQVAADVPLIVKLYGVVGADPSYRFDHAATIVSESEFELTLFGLQNVDPNRAWPQVLVEWHGREFVKQPPHTGPLRVVLHQADGSTLEAVVPVR